MNYRHFNRVLLWVVTALLVATATGCSLKKNTAASRKYMEFITRYNIYFNGDTHYKETLDEMEKNYQDDYSQTIFVHPAEARQNPKAPQPSGDFTRSIEKAQKAIQLRSIKAKPKKKPGKSSDPEYKAWMKREEYNPFLHNAWLMMGRSQFLNGDYLGSAATFFYISKHFTWLPETVLEAKLWQARSYIAIDWLFEAETIITRIKPEELENKDIKHLYNLTFTAFWIKSNDNAKAIPYLNDAIATASGAQKIRLNFLLGQLYESIGEKELAYKAFDVAGSASSATYRTKFNARIKQSEVFQGDNIEPEVKALKRMTNFDRNKEYLDQIYYAIGNLYLSHQDTVQAIENYILAAEKSTRNGIDKAYSQLTLGGLYYERGEYVDAQPCYSEAIPQIPENYPNYEALKRRSDFLDELTVYAQNVELQDSLLELSYMTPEEQTAVAERLIEELKKKEKEAEEQAKREEYLANQEAQGGGLIDQSTQQFTMNTDNSWYFYNSSTVTAGKTDFQRRWGSRKLEDNWRRRNKASYAFDEGAPTETEGEELEEGETAEDEATEMTEEEQAAAEAQERENDPHYVEYYLKQIPKTDEERATCNDVIQEGLYNMGVILKDKLEDFAAAEREFTELLTRFPDNIYRLDTYYNMYLMFTRAGDTANAETYRNLILSEFPDSNYGQAMLDPNYIENLRNMEAHQEQLYADAYAAYLENRNADVHRGYEEISKRYPLSKLMPKFMFIDALAYVTEDKPEDFKRVLTEMLDRYPDTDLSPYAGSYLKGLNEGRKLHSGTVNMRGMIWDISLTNDSTAVADPSQLVFDLNYDDSQLFILLYPTDQVNANKLLFDIATHNFTSFVVKDFDLEQMNFGRLGLLIIKPFANVSEINHYRSVLAEDKALRLPSQVRPVVISQKNFQTLLSSGASFDDYFRFVEDKTYRDTEERVLPPEFFGYSEGIAPEATEEATEATEAETPDVETTTETESAPETESDATKAEAEPVVAPTDSVATPIPSVETPTAPAETEAPAATTTEAPAATETPAATAPAPAEPVATPAKPETQPKQPAPTNPAATKPTTAKPNQTKPAPQKPAKPALPEYPTGSEGDDPLLDNP